MIQPIQLKHVLLDVEFFHKPKIVAFRRKFGWIATPWLIESYCQMSRATNALVNRDTLLGIAYDMRIDNGEELLTYCVDNGLIQELDGHFTNSRVIKDQLSLADKREKDRERQEKYRGAKENVTRDKNVTNAFVTGSVTVFPDTVPVTDIVTDLRSNNYGDWLDDITKEAALMAYTTSGLSESDFSRAKQIVERHWDSNPKKRRKSDIMASWVIQELQKEKLNGQRLNGKSNFVPHTAAATYEKNVKTVKEINFDAIRAGNTFGLPNKAIAHQEKSSGNTRGFTDVVVSTGRPKP